MAEATNTPWFQYYNTPRDHPWALASDNTANHYQTRLETALSTYINVRFDHIRIGHLGRRIAVFVCKGPQSAVLYDKTKGFPSAKLLASLALLGSN